jgi:hypothetical protein
MTRTPPPTPPSKPLVEQVAGTSSDQTPKENLFSGFVQNFNLSFSNIFSFNSKDGSG